jgi:predicted regulator of Ras-like GTPase activity (Roadblock/LC7/MglB family)
MSFEAILEKIVDDCSGALGIALMGSDGIPVAQVLVGAEDLGDELAAAGVEFGRILDEIRKVSDSIGGGRLEETIVGLGRFWLIFRAVDDELFLVVVLAPGGNVGKARFRVRRHLLELQEQL